jgi:hypothetical protein
MPQIFFRFFIVTVLTWRKSDRISAAARHLFLLGLATCISCLNLLDGTMGFRKRRDKFLQLAKEKPDGWPVIKSGVFRSHELVDAMREAVADYVKGGNIRAIGDFIEEAASLLPEGHGYREMVSDELCEFYGFIGDNESMQFAYFLPYTFLALCF